MVALVGVVAILGRMTFQEGLKTESTKSQAEALAAWMKDASGRRSTSDFQPLACAYKAADVAEAQPWGECARALFAAGGPFAGARNAFTGAQLTLVERCNPADLATAGQVAVDRITPTPPGSAVPVVVGPIADDERIGQKMTLRITVCDKGGYPIRVGETEF